MWYLKGNTYRVFVYVPFKVVTDTGTGTEANQYQKPPRKGHPEPNKTGADPQHE